MYVDSKSTLTQVYYFEKSETQNMCSAEIQERMKLSNFFPLQMSTTEW